MKKLNKTMDKVFIRNYVLFSVLLIGLASFMIYILMMNESDLDKKDDWIQHTHNVIIGAQHLSELTESMLASQRGYLLTGDDRFLDEYENKKSLVSGLLAELIGMVDDNPSQASRIHEIRNYFNRFSQELEKRAQQVSPDASPQILQDVEIIDGLRDDIMRINTGVLSEEYKLLNARIDLLEDKKSQYFKSLLIGVISASFLLLLFNWFLLNAQKKRSYAEASLQDTKGRFTLAVEGTQDGIFDWDLASGSVFYSGQFFKMLGYEERSAFTGTTEDFRDILHPEDAPRVWDYVGQYLNGELSEYNQKFRLKHQSGRWVWIQSRAKSLLDKNGKAYRLVGAHTDITHIIRMQEKLESEKKEAVNANQAKSDFLAHMSHEIRTPLTAISGIAEIFTKNQANLDEKQKKLVSTLSSSTTALKDLINDVLDFSKIESGEIDLEENEFELGILFQDVIDMMSIKASEKGISFILDYNMLKGKQFKGDKARIRQILINLIGNAIKFTDEGAVKVKAANEDRAGVNVLRVDVSDTGLGISPENFDAIFERFKQADASVSRKYGGTGLGLPISKNLARLMGGDIFLSSELGQGSTFSVLLPMPEMESAQENNSDSAAINKKLSAIVQSSLNEKTKVLLVEDYEGNILVIGHILEEAGVNYDVARNGIEATQMWSNNHYDLILMDVQMPEMDGFLATRHIRDAEKNQNLKHTPIIGMTAHALVGDKDKCTQAGMDSYLPKPIVESDLKREILKHMNKNRRDAA